MADLFSIIVLMEHLEKAFIRDSITADEYVLLCNSLFHHFLNLLELTVPCSRYTPQCSNLIAKYKTALNFLSDTVTDLESFMAKYKVRWPFEVIGFLKCHIGICILTVYIAELPGCSHPLQNRSSSNI